VGANHGTEEQNARPVGKYIFSGKKGGRGGGAVNN